MKHEEYIDILLSKLAGFDYISKHETYPLGELDIYGFKNETHYYYEVKSSKAQKLKAVKQVERFKRFFKGKKMAFLYIGNEDLLERLL